jgi:hypothetical protein
MFAMAAPVALTGFEGWVPGALASRVAMHE